MSPEKPTGRRGPKLLEQLARALRARRYSLRTEETYVAWVRSYIQHHGVRHPAQLGVKEVNAFLTHLAVERRASAATQSQARAALLFLYKEVLRRPLVGVGGEVVRGKKPKRLPTVLTRGETGKFTSAHEGYTATGGEYALRLRAPLDGRSSATGQGPRPGASGAVDPGRQGEPGPHLCHTGIFGLQTHGPDPGSPKLCTIEIWRPVAAGLYCPTPTESNHRGPVSNLDGNFCSPHRPSRQIAIPGPKEDSLSTPRPCRER